MIDVTLKPLKQFDTSGDGLKRGVSQLEQNVADALKRMGTDAKARLSPTALQIATYSAKVGDMVSAAGTFSVRLPVATSLNADEEVGVVVRSGTITVLPTSGTVQGGASDVLATVGLRRYTSDGAGGWWRAP